MLPFLQIGPLALPLPGLLILAGIWLGLSLAEANAHRWGMKSSDLYNLSYLSLISGLLGARLGMALRFPEAFQANPASLLSLNPDLLDSTAGVLTAILAGLVFGQRKHLAFWSTLDALTPALAVLMTAIGLSHLAAGSAFGAPSDLPWAIELWGAARHPSQVYESLAAGMILLLAWPGRNWLASPTPGVYFLRFASLSAAARLYLEAFRGDSQLILGGLRSAQVAAWLILASCLAALFYLRKIPAQAEPSK